MKTVLPHFVQVMVLCLVIRSCFNAGIIWFKDSSRINRIKKQSREKVETEEKRGAEVEKNYDQKKISSDLILRKKKVLRKKC